MMLTSCTMRLMMVVLTCRGPMSEEVAMAIVCQARDQRTLLLGRCQAGVGTQDTAEFPPGICPACHDARREMRWLIVNELRFNCHLEGFLQRCSDLTHPCRHRDIMQEHSAARSSPAECKSHSNTATCSRCGYHCSVLIHDARRHLESRREPGIANCLRSEAGENSHPEAQCSSLPVWVCADHEVQHNIPALLGW